MSRLSRLLGIAAWLGLAAGAGCIPARRRDTAPRGIPGGDGRALPGESTKGRSVGVSRKVVKGKREPVTLIADDKTECVVPESTFKETSIGERVTCDWRSP